MKKNVVRLLFALVALLTSANMLAENKLWIDPFTVPAKKTAEVTIQMTNEPSVAALQFNLILPKGLVFVQEKEVEGGNWLYIRRNPERFRNSQQLMSTLISADTLKCAVFALKDEAFIGTEGPLAFFNVQSSVGDTFEGKVKIEDIMMTTYGGERLACEENYEVDVVVNSQIGVASTESSLVMNPGTTFQFPITLYNPNKKIQGLQMDVKLPEGFSMGDNFEHTSRITTTSYVSSTFNKEDNTYRLVLVDPSGKYAVENTDTVYSTIFYCDINVPETIEADSKIVIENVIGSSQDEYWDPYQGWVVTESYSIVGEGAEIVVVNGGEAYTNATTVVAALQTQLNEALATIAETCPDVKDDFKGEDIQKAIDDLKAAIDAAYANNTLTSDYDNVIAPAETIEAQIVQLIADAQVAQEAKRVADNKAAYEADMAAIEALNESYNKTVAAIQAEFPKYENTDAELAVRNELDAAKDAIEKAYKAVADEGKYEYKLDVEALEASIQKLYDDAKQAAGDDETRQQANQGKYDMTLAEIAAVRAEADAALATIKEEYDLYDPTADMDAINAALDKAAAEAKAAFDAVQDAGDYDYVFDAAAVRAMIEEMLAKAKEVGAVEGIEAEVEAGNVVIFTLDGKRHANPVHGEVNIFVRKNGKTSKVMVD